MRCGCCAPAAGGPLEPSKRAAVPPLLYLRVLLWALLLGWTAFGTAVMAGADSGCWEAGGSGSSSSSTNDSGGDSSSGWFGGMVYSSWACLALSG